MIKDTILFRRVYANRVVILLVSIRKVEYVDKKRIAITTKMRFLQSNSKFFATKIPVWACLIIWFPLLNFSIPQLIQYTIIIFSRRARTDAEFPHLTHKFKEFANLLILDSVAKLSNKRAASPET